MPHSVKRVSGMHYRLIIILCFDVFTVNLVELNLTLTKTTKKNFGQKNKILVHSENFKTTKTAKEVQVALI
jgi:hypothetical protein